MVALRRIGLICGMLATVIGLAMAATGYRKTGIVDWGRVAQATSVLAATVFFFVIWPRFANAKGKR